MQCFLHGCAFSLLLYSIVSNGYMTGFMGHVCYLYSCTVLCDYLLTSALVASNVII